MNCNNKDLILYAITDPNCNRELTMAQQVEQAILGGATMIQLRDKVADKKARYEEAIEIQKICNLHQVPFLINDDVLLAKELNADGVHVGQSDMSVEKARAILGTKKIIGATAKTVEQAVLASEMGADYLGVGAVFTTSTKLDATPITKQELINICDSVSIPVVAIGGITIDNMSQLQGTKIQGIAVVSAVFAQDDIKKATKDLRIKAETIVLA